MSTARIQVSTPSLQVNSDRLGFRGGSVVKICLPTQKITKDAGLIPGSGRSPGVGNGNLLQYFCLENCMDRGAWWATVHGVTKSWTWLSDWVHAHACTRVRTHTHTHTHTTRLQVSTTKTQLSTIRTRVLYMLPLLPPLSHPQVWLTHMQPSKVMGAGRWSPTVLPSLVIGTHLL